MHPDIITFILTTFNDVDLSSKCWETLRTMLGPYRRLVVVDGGSKDESVAFWGNQQMMHGDGDNISVVTESNYGRDLSHLSHALNEGIQFAIESHQADYVVWVHADMKFDDQEWVDKLIQRMKQDPTIGKLHPFNFNDEREDQGEERPGNSCPWVIETKTLLEVNQWRLDQGHMNRNQPEDQFEFFNEGYTGIGGYEDWDLNNVILDLGYQVLITPISKVHHVGMGTRGRHDTSFNQRYNSGHYARIWGNAQPKV